MSLLLRRRGSALWRCFFCLKKFQAQAQFEDDIPTGWLKPAQFPDGQRQSLKGKENGGNASINLEGVKALFTPGITAG